MGVAGHRSWIYAAAAGATTGVLAELLVFRLNPAITQSPWKAIIGAPLFATWGALGAGVPLFGLLYILQRVRRRETEWPAPELTAVAFLIGLVMYQVNANVHRELLSGSEYRVLKQDATAWGICVVLALVIGTAIRRRSALRPARVVFVAAMMLLPVARMIWQPTTARFPLEVTARPLADPDRKLLVVGVEGLDPTVMLAHGSDARFEHLLYLRETGSWGRLRPHRPFLRRSLWTSVATGTLPGRHGVKSHWGWELPWLAGEPLRLLPWTPQGSRMILPWGIAKRVEPPPASVPPLWERIRASGETTAVFDWPGIWGPEVLLETPSAHGLERLDREFRASLDWALEPFPERGDEIWGSIAVDLGRVEGAVAAMESGARNLWLNLESLSAARRELEPIKAMHTREREVQDLVLEVVDAQLGTLLEAIGTDVTVALVSPYGLAPPDSLERLRRLLGMGDDWRTSAETCPDGLLLLAGEGVPENRRFSVAQMADVAPTLCYLLGLPVPQYMEGGIIVDAVEPEFLASHPLRVVD